MNKRRKVKTVIATIVAIILIMATFTAIASASDINISIDGDIPETIIYYVYTLKGPIQIGLNYFISFLQYIAGWVAQF
ncbi:hypothetical protein IKG45_03325 [Candidatus Saccharibacteria bacterium]|nr:hypothetical protein [Candidatus Saccharibacteria bacterium]